jgi:hypothetical protein
LGTFGSVSSTASTAEALGCTSEFAGQAIVVFTAATVVADSGIAYRGLQALCWDFDDWAGGSGLGLFFIVVHHNFNHSAAL